MTPVNSAAKMVGHLRRWLTGDEVTADGSCSAENVSGRCGTCTCNLVGGVPLQYRGRSYSDCCAVPCRGGHLDAESRDRSCSVSGRRMSLSRGWRRLGLNTYHTSSGSVWSSDRSSDVQAVLEEDHELCRCCEPVCCCERCFVYVDDRLPLLPPPYSELTVEHCTDVAAKVIDKPSVTVNTADVTVDADDNHPSLSADICPSAAARLDNMVNAVFFSFMLFCCLVEIIRQNVHCLWNRITSGVYV